MEKVKNILCSVSTRGRYSSTLPLCLSSILNQTKLPDHLVIFDDNDPDKRIDMREDTILSNILLMFEMKGVSWEVVFGKCQGQVHNHQIANSMGYEWCWRVDDDCIADANVLKELYEHTHTSATFKIGAVGGQIIIPKWKFNPWDEMNASSKIADIDKHYNKQCFKIKQIEEVDHLHCSFLYRCGIVNYNTDLSKVSHREETLFTLKLKESGYTNLIVCNAVTWHLKASGGIRTESEDPFIHDERIFLNYLNSGFLVVLNNGLGDHIVAKEVIKKLIDKHKNVTVACCYPDILSDLNVRLISIDQAERYQDCSRYNIYKWMAERNWNNSLQEAFEGMYL